ncbi:pyridoxamine 5'-phosphate oxidase family protein [Ponticaulis sp.]|uniref:pyridoxamine 5'-phosphate oxidase family protein n=1 Tax=Ponticaulis sp. TaxID=2020902 RepID=UPI000B668161|nr:pyridoxamine 5'-phosphate oxidase family protein [Ponticaulis sp.]MAI91625.1 hypothetical protein [Ponticaulis sp.]OUX97191.1 MAG: hypothetical protein CBB65_14385 [Hyphomonadaceae bacterium TMED5]|tara:strand:+ start:16701 stop:17291 length:591 start_codon:yes stop_codon:yes gene_type:complete
MPADIDRFSPNPSLIPVKEAILRNLKNATRKGESGQKLVSLASVAPDGTPHVRTVVIRSFDADEMTLTFFTDARSPKIAELKHQPIIQIMSYDPVSHEQMRIVGTADIHTEDELTRKSWQNIPEYGRGDYLTRLPPGSVISSPELIQHDHTLEDEYFTVIQVKISAIDWLKLSAQGHKRALLTWQDGNFSGEWRTP